MVLAAATVVSTHLDQTQQQNAGSNTWGFCVLAAPNAILDHSNLGREAILLPAADMASALAFHVAQCLFCFYFCFVTRESLGNSGSRPAPLPPPSHSRQMLAMARTSEGRESSPCCPGQKAIHLAGSSPEDSFVFHFMFPEFSFRLPTTRADTAPPASFLGDKSTKD